MRTIRNNRFDRSTDVVYGRISPRRASSMLPTVSDGTTEFDNISEFVFHQTRIEELTEGVADIYPGAGAAASNSATRSTPVLMLNNSGDELHPGTIVIVDDTDNNAVTTTSTGSNTKIVGIVQEPIPIFERGPVLFNGYAAKVDTEGSVTRGHYAFTSATAGKATGAAARGAGAFGVYTSGVDIPIFATASATTIEDEEVTSLSIDMPDGAESGRVLFLALFVDTSSTGVTISGWTRIGSSAGFWYYWRRATGDDTATAYWTTASPAVAMVLLLDESVDIATPVAGSDFDSSTTAASVSGLDTTRARYAIAGVHSDEATPAGWAAIASGASNPGVTPTATIVQAVKGDDDGSPSATLPNPVTVGNTIVAVCMARNYTGVRLASGGYGSGTDTSYTLHALVAADDEFGRQSMSVQSKIATSTFSGPFYTTAPANSQYGELYIFELQGSFSEIDVLSATHQESGSANLGSFSTVGAGDHVIFSLIFDDVTDVNVSAAGYTQKVDEAGPVDGQSWWWVGHRSGSGGSVSASATFTNDEWGGVAICLREGTTSVDGTLVGKYIGTDASVTSPFGIAYNAVIVFNLVAAPKASALLYGPDLGSGISLSDSVPAVESGSGSAGAASTASRSDHVHPADAGTGTFRGCSVSETTQTISHNTTTVISFTDADTYDTDGFHNPASNPDRITIPTGLGGYYAITFWVTWASNTTGRRVVRLLKNGANALGTNSALDEAPTASTGEASHTGSHTLNLAQGDYVGIDVYQNSGGDLAVNRAFMTVSRLG